MSLNFDQFKLDTTYYWVANAEGMNQKTSANSSFSSFKILSLNLPKKSSNQEKLSKQMNKSTLIAATQLPLTSNAKTKHKNDNIIKGQ